MRNVAKALACLLLCWGGGHVMPCEASVMHSVATGPKHVTPAAHTQPWLQGRLDLVDGRVVASKKKQKKKSSAAATRKPKPKAEPHDPSNRFRMTQDGKRMSADDFDAWMKSRGFRVAKGSSAKKGDD